MKKMIFIAAALLLCIPAISNAQPKAIGGRIGSSFEFSYQHSLAAGQNGYPNFIQVDFGAAFPFAPSDYFGALATGTYNFVLPNRIGHHAVNGNGLPVPVFHWVIRTALSWVSRDM